MDKVVGATPLMKYKMIMGGDGIEGRYMRSIEKCKPKYKGMWYKFNVAGGTYLGILAPALLRRLYQGSKVMVDLSYSKRFAQFGAHYNRSMFDAYNNGCVPLCVDVNTESKLFKRGVNYLAVPEDADFEDLAHCIDQAIGLNEDDANEIISKGRGLMRKHFDYHYVCKQILKVLDNKPAGDET